MRLQKVLQLNLSQEDSLVHKSLSTWLRRAEQIISLHILQIEEDDRDT